MAVQQNKKSRSKKGMRRAHHALVAPNIILCPNCKAPSLSHVVCPTCGTYKGRQYLRKSVI